MLLVLFLFLFSVYLFHCLYWKRRCLPEGPIPLPIIGNLHLMTDAVKPGYKLFENLKEEYGPVFTFWLANLPMVMVCDYQMIKQEIIKNGSKYVGRPEFPISLEIRHGAYGIIESNGDRWQQHRRFALHVLRNFGLGKNSMEEKVIGEMQSLIETIKKKSVNGVIDMRNYFDASVGSIINSLLFGYRYDETNINELIELKERMDKHFKIAAEPIGGLIGAYPWLGKVPGFSYYKGVVMDNWQGLMKGFRKQAMEKMKTIDYDSEESSDYVEAFLKERKKHENDPCFGGFEMVQLDSVCFDLWVAGMETTSNTLYWGLLYTLLNEEVREKVYEELDRVIGSGRIVTSSDRSQLNYINATINETQRLANLLAINLARTTTEDVEIGGKKVSKGTIVVPQISQVMYDPEIFPQPYSFNPDRFLEIDGSLKKVEEFIPFSVGKRQCLGEGLAKLELFIFYANIFNQFEIKLDESNPNPSIEKTFGVTMKAKNFNVVMTPRF